MTKAERQHLSRLAELGCVLCIRLGYYATPAEIHHIRDGQGMSQRASHFDAVPLCVAHHRGDDGLHGLASGPSSVITAWTKRFCCKKRGA